MIQKSLKIHHFCKVTLSKAKTLFLCKNKELIRLFGRFVCGTKNALEVSAGCLQSNKGSKRPNAKKVLGLIKHPN